MSINTEQENSGEEIISFCFYLFYITFNFTSKLYFLHSKLGAENRRCKNATKTMQSILKILKNVPILKQFFFDTVVLPNGTIHWTYLLRIRSMKT